MKGFLYAVLAAVLVTVVVADESGEDDTTMICNKTMLMNCGEHMEPYKDNTSMKMLEDAVKTNKPEIIDRFCMVLHKVKECMKNTTCQMPDGEDDKMGGGKGGTKPKPDDKGRAKPKPGGAGDKGQPKPGGADDKRKPMDPKMKERMDEDFARKHLPPIQFLGARLCNKDGKIKEELKKLMAAADFSCLNTDKMKDAKKDIKGVLSKLTKEGAVNYTELDMEKEKMKKGEGMKPGQDKGDRKGMMDREKEGCKRVQSYQNQMACKLAQLKDCNEETKKLIAHHARLFIPRDMGNCHKGKDMKDCKKPTPDARKKDKRTGKQKRIFAVVSGDPHFKTFNKTKMTCQSPGEQLLFGKDYAIQIKANLTFAANSQLGTYVSSVMVMIQDETFNTVATIKATQESIDEKFDNGKTEVEVQGTKFTLERMGQRRLYIKNKAVSMELKIFAPGKNKASNATFFSVLMRATDTYVNGTYGMLVAGCPLDEQVNKSAIVKPQMRRRRNADACGCNTVAAADYLDCAFDCSQSPDDTMGSKYKALVTEMEQMEANDPEFLISNMDTSSASFVHHSVLTSVLVLAMAYFFA